jgi:hypothetical protein
VTGVATHGKARTFKTARTGWLAAAPKGSEPPWLCAAIAGVRSARRAALREDMQSRSPARPTVLANHVSARLAYDRQVSLICRGHNRFEDGPEAVVLCSSLPHHVLAKFKIGRILHCLCHTAPGFSAVGLQIGLHVEVPSTRSAGIGCRRAPSLQHAHGDHERREAWSRAAVQAPFR